MGQKIYLASILHLATFVPANEQEKSGRRFSKYAISKVYHFE
jgi:hypothetical protein